MQDTNRKSGSERQFVEVKLKEVEQQLNEARADRREGTRERKVKEAVDAMRRLFPGVHGRLTDLGTVPQKQYQVRKRKGDQERSRV
jgi:structural maintenance of chromosome 1